MPSNNTQLEEIKAMISEFVVGNYDAKSKGTAGDPELDIILGSLNILGDVLKTKHHPPGEEQLIKAVLRSSPDLILRVNRAGEYKDFIANNFNDLLIQPDKIKGASIATTPFPEQVKKDMLYYLDKAIGTDVIQYYSYELDIHGSTQYFDARIVKVEEDEAICFVQNTTDSKRYERRLEDNNRDLTNLINTFPGIVYRCLPQPKRNLVYINEGCGELTGYRTDQMLRDLRRLSDIIHEDDRAHVEKTLLKALSEKQPYRIEYRIISRHQEVIKVFDQGMPHLGEDGDIISLTGFITDVTTRSLIEDALIASESKYRSLVENMKEGITVMDNEQKIIFVNDQFCEMTGFNEMELIGLKGEDLVYEPDRELFNRKLSQRGKGVSDQYEIRLKTKSGKIFWDLVKGSPVYDQKGNITGAMGTHTDMTAWKNVEENLRIKNEELETFIYRASHDLRGPIATTQGLVKVAAQRSTNLEMSSYLQLIQETTKKLENILDDLTQVAFIKQGSLDMTVLNFNDIISTIKDHCSDQPNFKKIKFKVKNRVDDPIYSDEKLVEIFLRNLIQNSIKYFDKDCENPTIEIFLETLGGEVCIKIKDNGIGIPRANQKKIFDMFYRGTEQSNGSGLGLYIVKNAVEKLGGRISCTSELGKGSEFTVYLPISSSFHSEEELALM